MFLGYLNNSNGGGLPTHDQEPVVISQIVALTQAQYDALRKKEPDVLYLIKA